MVANVRKSVSTSSGTGGIIVKNDGITLASDVRCINIDGASEVEALLTGATEVTIYHPAPTFQPYWPTGVTDTVERVTARISTPAGGEGTPFNTGGWAGTNQDASRSTTVSLPAFINLTGFGGDSTFLVEVFDADGTTLLDSYTTPALTGDATHTSPSTRITVDIASYGADTLKWQALPTVTVDIGGVFTDNGLAGGRYHVVATHTTDTTTDGAQVLVFTQSDVFLDTNPTTPFIVGGQGTHTEVPGFVATKHLSGLEYYVLTSRFSMSVASIDQLNRNAIRTSGNLQLVGAEYGLPTVNHSPFGTGSTNFSNWTNDHDQDSVSYLFDTWEITQSNYRYIGPTGNATAQPRDPWSSGYVAPSFDRLILVDTYGQPSTITFDGFDDEEHREYIDGIGGAATSKSFGGAGTWDSEKSVSISGTLQAQVFNSKIMVPDQTTYIRTDGANTANADWTNYKPNPGGNNPDYSSLSVGTGVQYARRFTQTPGTNIPSFSFVFSGTFAGGSALADLQSGDLEIYVYRISKPGGTPGNVGAPPSNTAPLRVHESFNFAIYDDGATVGGSGIREGSSSGNTINCTFGTGTPADTGFYMHLIIKNSNIEINSIAVTFF